MAAIAVTAAQVAVVYPQDAEIHQYIAAAAITAGQLVYRVAASGKAGLADANAAGLQQARGIALQGVGAGQAVNVLVKGHVYGFTLSGNYDSIGYLSDTAGGMADAAGTMTVPVGRVAAMNDQALTKVFYADFEQVVAWS